MTPLILIDSLIPFVESVVADFVLDSNVKGVKKAPQVIAGYLKEKQPNEKQDPPDFPYVILRFLDGSDADGHHTVRIKIMAGTYSQDAQHGWRDPVNILQRIKDELLKLPYLGPFQIVKPVKTELPEEQPYPEWVAWMILQVIIPQIIVEGGNVL